MSGTPTDDPGGGDIETMVLPRTHDLGGGFDVARMLPAAERRMVGPFVFFDRMGPAVFSGGAGLDVRPHPHIGLATVTYLFDGEILHRDSIGSVQPIRPGEVNWMTAGRGIAHSERTPALLRGTGSSLSGIQLWVGLPREHEETAPNFVHHGAGALPLVEAEGKRVRLIAGTLFGTRAPVATLSALFFADAALMAGARLTLSAEHEQRALYLVDGELDIGGVRYAPGRLLVLRPGRVIDMTAPAGARVLLLGGAPLDGPRHLWWDFVSSSKERIEQAKADWQEGRFDRVIGETEFIPLPE